MSTHPTELEQLADLYGITTSYEDVKKNVCRATPESLLATLKVLGADIRSMSDAPKLLKQKRAELASRGMEPVIVAWEGKPNRFLLTVPKNEADDKLSYTLKTESGKLSEGTLRGRHTFAKTTSVSDIPSDSIQIEVLTPAVELGYHQFTIKTKSKTFESWIIAAPSVAASQGEAESLKWGCFLPLYAVRSEHNWGAGDFTDLEKLTGWVRSLGGKLVGTLPILAAYLDEPFEPSPYSPASRLFWNEFYIDIARVPELKHCEAARKLIDSAEFQTTLAEVRKADLVDYRRIMAAKREVLELLANDLASSKPQRFGEFLKFTQQKPHLREYAAFRAAHEQRRTPWWDWPSPLNVGELAVGDYDQPTAMYHSYVQWIVDEQLRGLAEQADHPGEGLYLDLPLGVRSDSFDVWRNQDAYVRTASAGAPPDAFFTKGQDWGFPPMHPDGMRAEGYRHIREYLSHHMHLASTLRIDHVMGLHRLYWVPHGLKASQGVYVRYRPEELYAVICMESQRHNTTIIGENLGTVPPAVNESLDRHGIRKMFIVQYELHPDKEELVTDVPKECIASLNTHDMPMFNSWVNSRDLPQRIQLGLLTEEEAEGEKEHQKKLKQRFQTWLHSNQWMKTNTATDKDMLRAILNWLAASPAEEMLVNVEDLWQEVEPQNVPGTGPELPNWKRKAAIPFEQFSNDPELLAILKDVSELRKKAGKPAAAKSKKAP